MMIILGTSRQYMAWVRSHKGQVVAVRQSETRSYALTGSSKGERVLVAIPGTSY